MPTAPDWSLKTFDELDVHELYDIVRLRVDVFVVEQACIYPELDGIDVLTGTWHCQGRLNGNLVAYARLIGLDVNGQNGVMAAPIKIGRVLTHESHRGQGLARQLMMRLLAHAGELAPERPIALSAQTAVVGFYQSIGFTVVSDEYIEDGIPHIDMALRQK